jgi:hypothetical protein
LQGPEPESQKAILTILPVMLLPLLHYLVTREFRLMIKNLIPLLSLLLVKEKYFLFVQPAQALQRTLNLS